jgi:hypothetical protein
MGFYTFDAVVWLSSMSLVLALLAGAVSDVRFTFGARRDNLVSVEVNLDDFRRHFEILSDEALLSTNREELVERARGCYDEEVARRGLDVSEPDEPIAEAASSEAQAVEEDELIRIATYNVPDEANLARGLLQSAGIPFHLENEGPTLGFFQVHLLVPASLEEPALEILATEISEEELAAQAEAAGVPEEDSAEA